MVKAMVLAAGEGTRLRPYTLTTPKVMLPIGGVPLIGRTLNWLRSYGIDQVAINLCCLGDKIEEYLGDGSRLGVNITYSLEENLLGTAGGVQRLRHFFDGTFVVICGDVLANLDLDDMLWFHQMKNALATIAVLRGPDPWESGVVDIDQEGKVLGFVEKPPRGTETSDLINGGVYIMETEIFNYIPDNGYSDFARAVFPKMIALNLPVYGYTLKPEDYLADIGTVDKYQRLNEDAGK